MQPQPPLTKERPIIFSGPMVQAILAGRKTQTRRVVKFPSYAPNPDDHNVWWCAGHWQDGDEIIKCPYGQPGDRLYVRETIRRLHWGPYAGKRTCDSFVMIHYLADRFSRMVDYPDEREPRASELKYPKVISARYMPKWASRIMLEITGIRAERIQEITEEDAIAEGAPNHPGQFINGNKDALVRFAYFWNSLNAKPGFGWEQNPWVWVIKFKKICP